MNKKTKQNVRDLNHLPAKKTGRKLPEVPDFEAIDYGTDDEVPETRRS